MFSSPHSRKFILALALPLLAVTTTANAGDTERDKLVSAIEGVTAKIKIVKSEIEKIDDEISRLEADLTYYAEMFERTKKDEYKKAAAEVEMKIAYLLNEQQNLETEYDKLIVILQDLQEKLAELDG